MAQGHMEIAINRQSDVFWCFYLEFQVIEASCWNSTQASSCISHISDCNLTLLLNFTPRFVMKCRSRSCLLHKSRHGGIWNLHRGKLTAFTLQFWHRKMLLVNETRWLQSEVMLSFFFASTLSVFHWRCVLLESRFFLSSW